MGKHRKNVRQKKEGRTCEQRWRRRRRTSFQKANINEETQLLDALIKW
jgi:hypothetical protein